MSLDIVKISLGVKSALAENWWCRMYLAAVCLSLGRMCQENHCELGKYSKDLRVWEMFSVFCSNYKFNTFSLLLGVPFKVIFSYLKYLALACCLLKSSTEIVEFAIFSLFLSLYNFSIFCLFFLFPESVCLCVRILVVLR